MALQIALSLLSASLEGYSYYIEHIMRLSV